jgi:predicted lipid-binding transport protein (Tim44 family)
MSGFLRACTGVMVLAPLAWTTPVSAQTQTQTQQQQQAEANRQRCTNGVLIGGAAGGVLARGGVLNRLGGAAIGATAGCVINRGVNEGR